MRRVEIDEQVYERLAQHAVGFETPNDVLRRLVLTDDLDASANGKQADRAPAVSAAPAAQPTPLPGALQSLVVAGAVKPEDRLVHRQVRKGRSFAGHVDEHGCIRTDLGHYREPSPALRDLVGTQIDGWAYWTHEPSGKTLRRLREENGGKPRGSRQ